MLRVPRLRQPDDTSCLPTCVEAVLQFLGYDCSYSEVREWCHATPSGCDADLAIQGLHLAALKALAAALRDVVGGGARARGALTPAQRASDLRGASLDASRDLRAFRL